MITIDVRSNLREVAGRFTGEVRDKMRPAIATALNRAATTTRAAAVREIRGTYNIKAGTVRNQIKLTRANRARLEALLTASGRRIPLIEFQARQTRQGVTAQVKRAGGRKPIQHAFIQTMRSGHRGVFIRATAASGPDPVYRARRLRKRGSDLPIAELTSLSLPTAFLNRVIQGVLVSTARQRFPLEFDRALRALALRA